MAGSLRKQTIISSILVYIGFGIGALNTLLFTQKGGAFNPDQYALTRLFFDIGQLFFCLATLSSLVVLNKFYPYYKDNLPDRENDLFTRVLTICVIGCIVTALGGYVFEPVIVRKFSEKSKLLVDYYHWTLIFGIGITMYSAFEAYCWSIHKPILPSFLRETAVRVLTLLLILLYFFKAVTFQHFIFLFSLLFFVVGITLLIYLLRTGQLHITFKVSRVTKKFRKKMLAMQWLTFGGITIITIGQTIDGIIIAGLVNLKATAIYTFAQYAANLVQVPQRSIQNVSLGVIARAWKDKKYAEINRIYNRSSINMLILGLLIFGIVWLNVADGIRVLHIQDDFANAIIVITVIGATRIIDAGTGVNQIILATSNKWKFEFYSGVIMLALRIVTAYIFVKKLGLIGSAYAELLNQVLFNFVRFWFLHKTYNMQPFTIKTLYALVVGVAACAVTYLALHNFTGWLAIIARTAIFSLIVVAGTFTLKLTPDADQMLQNFKKKYLTR